MEMLSHCLVCIFFLFEPGLTNVVPQELRVNGPVRPKGSPTENQEEAPTPHLLSPPPKYHPHKCPSPLLVTEFPHERQGGRCTSSHVKNTSYPLLRGTVLGSRPQLKGTHLRYTGIKIPREKAPLFHDSLCDSNVWDRSKE